MGTYELYSFFNTESDNNFEKDHLYIDYIKNCFDEEESLYFLKSLMDKIKWKQDYINFFG